MEILGEILMCSEERMQQIVIKVVGDCVSHVNAGKPFDAEPWIMLEENIGYEKTKRLFSHSIYSDILNLLDLYCHSAQHDIANINGIPINDFGNNLIESINMLAKKNENQWGQSH